MLLKVNREPRHRSIRGQREVGYQELTGIRVTTPSVSAYINARPRRPAEWCPLRAYVLTLDEFH